MKKKLSKSERKIIRSMTWNCVFIPTAIVLGFASLMWWSGAFAGRFLHDALWHHYLWMVGGVVGCGVTMFIREYKKNRKMFDPEEAHEAT